MPRRRSNRLILERGGRGVLRDHGGSSVPRDAETAGAKRRDGLLVARGVGDFSCRARRQAFRDEVLRRQHEVDGLQRGAVRVHLIHVERAVLAQVPAVVRVRETKHAAVVIERARPRGEPLLAGQPCRARARVVGGIDDRRSTPVPVPSRLVPRAARLPADRSASWRAARNRSRDQAPGATRDSRQTTRRSDGSRSRGRAAAVERSRAAADGAGPAC